MSKQLIDLVVLTSRLLQPKYATIEKTGKLTVRSQSRGPTRSARMLFSLTIIFKIHHANHPYGLQMTLWSCPIGRRHGVMKLWCCTKLASRGHS